MAVFFFFVYLSFLILFLTFDVSLAPDFLKYYNYYLFYDGQIQETGIEQGHFYFYFCFFVSYLFKLFFNSYSTNEIINLSLHIANSLFFVYGLIGYSKYLLLKGFKKNNIYLSFTVLCFLPSLIELRLTLKPELLAFAFFGWLFYFLHKHSDTKNDKYIYFFVFKLSILITSKASLTVMVVIFLLIEIWTNYKYLFSKRYLKFYLITIFLCSVLLVENSNYNGKYFNQVDHSENYNNRADFSFFSTINSEHLIANPNRYFHDDSFISITLFDTFSDFFLLYWNSEHTELNKGRKNFFKINRNFDQYRPPTIEYNKNEKFLTIYGNFDARYADSEYTNETRMRGAYKFSILFYVLLLFLGFLKNTDRNKLLSPFLGIFIVSLSALGIFGNNFDPLVADSVKTYYYSFFIALGFLFFLNYIFAYNIGRKTISILLVVFFLFIIGFPHSYDIQNKDDIAYKNSLLPTCEMNARILDKVFEINIDNRCNPENFIKKANNKVEKFGPVQEIAGLNYKFNMKTVPIFNILTFLFSLFFSLKKYLNKYIGREI